MLSSNANVAILVDFDGTIVPGDVTDHILQSFAGPQWLVLEKEWQSGRMNSRDCLGAQVDLIRASRADIYRAVNERTIDPAFPEFVAICESKNVSVTVVSDGFDLAIEATLERHGLKLPYYANHLKWLGDNRWRLEFPYRNSACKTEAGNCKCRQIANPPIHTVVIGDGRSDFCAASNADFVLSKASLTTHCTDLGLAHLAFAGFDEVIAHFDVWMERARASSQSRNSIGSPRLTPAGSQSSFETKLKRDAVCIS